MPSVSDPGEVRKWCNERRSAGRRIGLVPTMGYLHEGHLSLVRRALERADDVVVSIFVNPLQFGKNEDLARYPRNKGEDLRKCAENGVGLVFAPSIEDMYSPAFETYVAVAELSKGLCGGRRPGHFRGVCTVVAKLFNIVGPCIAVFGEKDYQQLQIIRKMVSDLHFPVDVVASPIVREADGLAMSSRNAYLTPEQRESASVLHRALELAREAAAATETLTADELKAKTREVIERVPEAYVDYIAVRDASTLKPIEALRAGETLVALAVCFGDTRLIDNIVI